jgi:hypothetical protein
MDSALHDENLRCHAILRIAAPVVALTVTWLGPSTSFAESPGDLAVPASTNRWQKPLALEAHLGVGTPRGFAGIALDVTPVPWGSFNLSLGRGMNGVQYAGMARVRLAPTPVTGGVGAGVSAGRYVWDNSCRGPCAAILQLPDITRVWSPAIWGNVEAFIEGRSAGRFQWRVYVGMGRQLNGESSTCRWQSLDGQRPSGCDGTLFLGYFGTALGMTL